MFPTLHEITMQSYFQPKSHIGYFVGACSVITRAKSTIFLIMEIQKRWILACSRFHTSVAEI
jgi:hypothetical protein